MSQDIKTYPRSEESEEAVLGSIIKDGASVFEKANAWIRDPEAFYFSKNKVLWNIVTEMHRNGEHIDMITVLDKVKNKDKIDDTSGLTMYYITGLQDAIPTSANVESYSKIVWEKFIKRQSIKSAHELYKTGFENQDSNVETLLHEHSRLIEELLEIAPSRKKDIGLVINETVETLRTGKNIIKFGYPQLDNIAGGMTRKELTVIGGRPGHGKTTLTLNIVASLLKQGYRVMLFNREMSNVEVIKKFMIMQSRDIMYEHLRTGNIEEGRLQSIEMHMEELKESLKNLIPYDDIRNLDDAMREIQREKPDVVVDDYIQLIKVDGRRSKDRRFENTATS